MLQRADDDFVIGFIEKVRHFLRHDAYWLDILTYFLLKAPAISYQIAPLAILMATLLTFGLLSRGHEITAHPRSLQESFSSST